MPNTDEQRLSEIRKLKDDRDVAWNRYQAQRDQGAVIGEMFRVFEVADYNYRTACTKAVPELLARLSAAEAQLAVMKTVMDAARDVIVWYEIEGGRQEQDDDDVPDGLREVEVVYERAIAALLAATVMQEKP